MVNRYTLFAALPLLILASLARAQATAPAPQNLQATVRQVVGNVQVRQTEADKWKEATVGMVVDEGAEFRTAPRSRVILQIPPDQTIVLDRLGVVKLLIAKRTNANEVRTSLGMPYGRTQYLVEEAGLQHNANITSPGATLAVRGTKDMLLFDQGPFAPVAFASQPVRFRNAKGQTISFGRAGARAHVAADKNSPGEQSLVETRVDPAGAFSGRTQSENAVLAYLARVAPDLDISQFRLLQLITDPNFKGTAAVVLPTAGQLQFTLIWTTSVVSDVDLTVTSPKGEIVSSTNPRVKSSGHHFGDEASIKGFGQESVVWEVTYPLGTYTITVSLKPKPASKGGSATSVFVVRDPATTGETLGSFSDKLSTQNPTATHTIDVKAPAKTGGGTTTPAKARRK